MRVRCSECGALYELDDQRIPDTGLAVKCSRCEHIFVAKRSKRATKTTTKAVTRHPTPPPDLAAPPSPSPLLRDSALPFSNTGIPPAPVQDEPAPYYSLRRPDGKVYSFRDMATLQRWIVERKALRVDELSQDGVTWVPLGNIPELSSFFDVVDRSSGMFQAPQMAGNMEPEEVPAPRTTMQMAAYQAPAAPAAPVTPSAPVAPTPIEESPSQASAPSPATVEPNQPSEEEQTPTEPLTPVPQLDEQAEPSPGASQPSPMVTPDEMAGQMPESMTQAPIQESSSEPSPKAESEPVPDAPEPATTNQTEPQVTEQTSPEQTVSVEENQVPEGETNQSTAEESHADSGAFFANETPVQAKTPTVIVDMNTSIANEARERTSGLYESQEPDSDEQRDAPEESVQDNPEESSQVEQLPVEESSTEEETAEDSQAPSTEEEEAPEESAEVPDEMATTEPEPSLDDEWNQARQESEWDDLDLEHDSGSGIGKYLAMTVVLLGVLAALWVFVVQDMVFPKGPSPKALETFNEAKVQTFFFSMESLLEAEKTLVPVLEKEQDFARGYALLAMIQVSRSDLLQQEMKSLQAEIATLTEEITAAGNDKEKLAPLIETKKKRIQEFSGLEKDFNKYSSTAYGYAEKAFKLNPENPWPHLALADYYRQGGDAVKAKQHLDKAESLDKPANNDALIAYLKGTLFGVDQALYKDAHRSFDLAFKKDPTLVRSQWSQALLYLKENNPKQALVTLNEILQLHPGHRPSKELAETLTPKEEPKKEEEKADVKKATAQKNSRPAAPVSEYQRLLNQANRERRNFNTAKALELFTQAKAEKETSAAWTGIGLCHLDMSKFGDATKALEKAVSLGKTPQAVMNLAIAYEGQGNPTKALKYYKIYVQSWPNARNAGEARSSIERLQ